MTPINLGKDSEVQENTIVEEPTEFDQESASKSTQCFPISPTVDSRRPVSGQGLQSPGLMEAARSLYESSQPKLSTSPVQIAGFPPRTYPPGNLYDTLASPQNFFTAFSPNYINRRGASVMTSGEVHNSEGFELVVKNPVHVRSMSDGPLIGSSRKSFQADLPTTDNKPSIRGDFGRLIHSPTLSSHGPPSISLTPTLSEARLLGPNSQSTSSNSSSGSAVPNHFFEKFKIRILKVNHNMELNQPYVKVTFGDKVFTTAKSQSLSGDWNMSFEFLVSYHYQLFGTCQLDLYESSWLLPDVHRGRAEIRLASLEGFPRKFESYYELYEKKYSMGTISELARRTKHMQNMGAIQVQIQYRFMQPSDWEENEEQGEAIVQPLIGEELVKIDDEVASPRKRHSLLVADPNYLDHEDDDTMFDFVGSYILSKDMRAVLRGVARVYLAFFQGMELRYVEFFSGVLLLEKFSRHEAMKEKLLGDHALTNFGIAREACRMHRFSMAVYGWRGLMVFGRDKAIGPVQGFSDPRAVLAFLDMDESHLLGYEFHTSQVFQPTYFIALDGDALVLSIRGTMGVLDALTDLVCDYLPWRGGLVHSGILSMAQSLMRNVIPGLMSHAVQHQVRRIDVVGHSLGAGAASVLTMMLIDHLHEFRLPGPTMEIRCFAYGPPPSVSASLAEIPRYRNCIHSIINGNDLVPRLSYGSMIDFKHMVLAATEAANDNVGSFLSIGRLASAFQTGEVAAEAQNMQFKALERARDHQNEVQHLNPKLYLPGKLHFIKTSNQLPEPFSYVKTTTDIPSPNRSSSSSPEPDEPLLTSIPTSPPLAKESLKPPYNFMVVEAPEEFLDFRVHASMLLDHLPSYYNKALENCLELIERFDDKDS